jgi:hypothetical protein
MQRAYDDLGVAPGFESSFYFGLLASPMSAECFAAATTYSGSDMSNELKYGTAFRDDADAWNLTEVGRAAATATQTVIGEAAAQLWSARPIGTMPGLSMLPRLIEFVGRLLEAGRASGGPAFLGLTPVFEPAGADDAAILMTRLGALRHHRADAHRAAWRAAGFTVEGIRDLPEGPERRAIEDDTNRLDEPIYKALTASERLELMAGLGALPDGLSGESPG